MRPEGWMNPYYTQNSSDFENSQRSKAYEAGADAITPIVAKAIFELMTDDKYTKVLFHKGTYPELKAKLGEFFTLGDG